MSEVKRPIGEFWGEVGYVLVLNPLLIESILKTIGAEDRHVEALIVKKEGAKYIEVWEIPFLPYAEYAYRLK